MACANLGGDRCETLLQILDMTVAKLLVEPLAKPLPIDQARTGEIKVEVAKYAPTRERARKLLQRVEVIGGVAGAHDSANGRSHDDVRLDASLGKCFHDADVGPASRSAAS